MIDPGEALLLIAHPGHELLLHGWLRRTKPVVHVLTDGSSAPRLGATAELLRESGAVAGTIFGRLSDAEAYAMILEGNAALVSSLATELAEEIAMRRPAMIVVDAVEGYNPVHDLCRLIAGAAIEIADTATKLYEYAVVNAPDSCDGVAFDLDDDVHAAKIESARARAALVPDIEELLSRHGTGAYRRELLRPVADWTDVGGGARPLYERFGEKRVAAHRYAHVIRRAEHMVPLRDALRAAVEKRSCAF